MLKPISLILVIILLIFKGIAIAQVGGGDMCSQAIAFNSDFLNGCPSVSPGNQFSNDPPNSAALDPSAPTPPGACVSATAGYDQWFFFDAVGTTGEVIVNPRTSLNVVIEVFSGTCGSLTTIGCMNIAGNNQIETLLLTGLTNATRYFFRIFGAANGAANRHGTFDFCGTNGAILTPPALPIE